ncbi:MAG: carboxynorspermidine decarboxylase [Oscillospiraceae bacterium]|nr:carboxynorspermidine decarboxylase [Oscillospiraceae bacterium]
MNSLPTPCFLVDTDLIERNLQILRGVADRTGCKILLAQKAFSMYVLYPLIGSYLAGATASGLYEAKLAREHMLGENHVFSAAYRPDEFDEIADICSHIIFNSFAQLERYAEVARSKGASIGLRVNPEHSTQGGGIYDPCAPGSRLGITRDEFDPALFNQYGVEGLHFHTLCEQNADDLLTTLAAFEEKFAGIFSGLKWLNLGGGHHITRADYDIPALESCVCRLQEKYGVQVYLEPGEAIALNAGYLITTVLDIVRNGGTEIAILDTSAACHMPDVLEGPYRPPLQGAGQSGEKPHTYRLGGPTCLAGDIIGDYSFDAPLKVGDRLCFEDMAIYSMVKTNTFNGVGLPGIALLENGVPRIVKTFGYEDFKGRLS